MAHPTSDAARLVEEAQRIAQQMDDLVPEIAPPCGQECSEGDVVAAVTKVTDAASPRERGEQAVAPQWQQLRASADPGENK